MEDNLCLFPQEEVIAGCKKKKKKEARYNPTLFRQFISLLLILLLSLERSLKPC